MKKIAISFFVVFTVIFVCMTFLLYFANDKLYALLYPYDEIKFDDTCPREITLQNGDYFIFGTYNGERLVWECVLGNKAQCDKIIEFREYDSYDSDWESCDLRKWLNANDGFAGNSNINKEIINGEFYILSKNELNKIGNITKQPTLSAIRSSNSKYLFLRKNYWYWTSSSISTNSKSVATVTQNGGFYKTLPTDSLTGVCPAFTLKSATLHILGGNGSKQEPYVIG